MTKVESDNVTYSVVEATTTDKSGQKTSRTPEAATSHKRHNKLIKVVAGMGALILGVSALTIYAFKIKDEAIERAHAKAIGNSLSNERIHGVKVTETNTGQWDASIEVCGQDLVFGISSPFREHPVLNFYWSESPTRNSSTQIDLNPIHVNNGSDFSAVISGIEGAEGSNCSPAY